MPCKVQNLTYRPVSIRGNSGQTWHLPPRSAIDVLDVEVMDNPKVTKLIAQGVISLQPEEGKESASRTPDRRRRARAS